MKLGMYSIGPGRYKAFMAIRSAKTVGFKALMCFCIPGDSYWNTPTVSPRWKSSYVFSSSKGKFSGSNSIPCLAFTILTVSLIRVKVFNPKKSIFSKPALSTTELSNWVQYISESFAKATGTNLVMSSGVIITPHACIPVLRTDPSKI